MLREKKCKDNRWKHQASRNIEQYCSQAVFSSLKLFTEISLSLFKKRPDDGSLKPAVSYCIPEDITDEQTQL